MIDPTFRNINRLFVLSYKNGDDDPASNSFDNYYMPLVEIKDFNAFIDYELFFNQPVKTNKRRTRNLFKCQETMTIQQETFLLPKNNKKLF